MSRSDGSGGLPLFDIEGKQLNFVCGSVRMITMFLFLHLCCYAFSECYNIYSWSPCLNYGSYNAHEVVVTHET